MVDGDDGYHGKAVCFQSRRHLLSRLGGPNAPDVQRDVGEREALPDARRGGDTTRRNPQVQEVLRGLLQEPQARRARGLDEPLEDRQAAPLTMRVHPTLQDLEIEEYSFLHI